jgi:ABC-type branched-subunit amino acid transport system ATPase component
MHSAGRSIMRVGPSIVCRDLELLSLNQRIPGSSRSAPTKQSSETWTSKAASGKALGPKILLLDEPAAGILSSEIHVLLDAIQSLPNDIAILMIEHDMQMVKRFASSVSLLVNGELLMTGAVDEVMNSQEVRSVYLGSIGQDRFNLDLSRV